MTTREGPPAITARGLRKSYGRQFVLDGVDLHVPFGTTFALLGPNGAGKTTAVQNLSTLIEADGGELRVAGTTPSANPTRTRPQTGPRATPRQRPQSLVPVRLRRLNLA